MRRTSILVIEDDEPIAEFLRVLLEQLDQKVVVARDGQEGLDQAKICPPDLILLDLSLPVVDGWEIARKLKSDPATREIPLIAVTGARRQVGFSDDEDRLDAYVEKPFAVSDLEETLRPFLTRA